MRATRAFNDGRWYIYRIAAKLAALVWYSKPYRVLFSECKDRPTVLERQADRGQIQSWKSIRSHALCLSHSFLCLSPNHIFLWPKGGPKAINRRQQHSYVIYVYFTVRP